MFHAFRLLIEAVIMLKTIEVNDTASINRYRKIKWEHKTMFNQIKDVFEKHDYDFEKIHKELKPLFNKYKSTLRELDNERNKNV